MTIEQEIPFTNEAILIYIQEAEKRIKYLQPFISEYNKLKNRIKVCKERLDRHDKNR